MGWPRLLQDLRSQSKVVVLSPRPHGVRHQQQVSIPFDSRLASRDPFLRLLERIEEMRREGYWSPRRLHGPLILNKRNNDILFGKESPENPEENDPNFRCW